MQVNFTNQKSQYGQYNRNNYIYLLASNCNRAGIPEPDTLQLRLQNFDLNSKEITASVKSAYNHHSAEFAKFANVAKLQSANDQNAEDYLKNTPSIPEELYHQLPQILKQGALAFIDERERDVFLTGALGILSGCLPNVKGIYAQQEVFPNLFTFTIAPAASGKGALKFAKQLADEYHTQVLNASKEADAQYQQQEAAHKQMLRNAKRGETVTDEPPVKPPYSDMLRKSFHHERLSSSRKTNNEFTEVNNPCLSIALSGTPNQVTGLIASAEDGLVNVSSGCYLFCFKGLAPFWYYFK